MQCIFLTQEGKECRCEVLTNKYGNKGQWLSSWVCEHSWESLCPHFQEATQETDRPVQQVVNRMQVLDASLIGHINRIGGYRVLLPDLI